MAEWFLSLENFKSIHRLERLHGRAITLLLGPNNAGKTSLLQALLLLKGSLAYPEAVLSFRNDLLDLGSFRGTVTEGEESIAITLGSDSDETWQFFLRVDTREGTLQIRECEITANQAHFLYSRPFSKAPVIEYRGNKTKTHAGGSWVPEKLKWKSFLPQGFPPNLPTFDTGYPSRFLDALHYIGPLRVYPKRYYPFQHPPTFGVGVEGKWAPYILRTANVEQLRDLRQWVGRGGFGLVQDVRVRDIKHESNFVVEVNIRGQWINLRDVGFGMSQLLPIVIESILAPATQSQEPLLLLEQPEIHLHPKAQANLGAFIAEMARKGRNYLIETHSEYMVMRLATEVRRGNISPDDITIYFLSLDEHGHTQFQHIALEKDGRLPPPSEWPEGFFDTDIDEADAFLSASPALVGG